MRETITVRTEQLQNNVADILFFCAALTSSFDIFLTVDILSFNVRITQIFQGLLVFVALLKCIQEKVLIIPRNFVLLGIFVLVNLACTLHTVLPMWNVAYNVWLILFVFMVWAVGVLYVKRFERLLELYVVSFYLMAGWGIIQFALGITGISDWMITQWWMKGFPRVNGFTYEPSYYATYMMIGYLFVQSCCLFGVLKVRKVPIRPLCYLSAAALVLCSSRMAYIPIVCMILFVGIKLLISLRKKEISSKEAFIELTKQSAVVLMVVAYFLLMQLCLIVQNKIYISSNEIHISSNEDESYSAAIRTESILLRNVGADGDASNVYTRLDGWKTSWKLFCESPLYGYGLGGISAEGMRLKGMSMEEMKIYGRGAFTGNAFLEILAATGVIGGVAFFAYGWTLVSPTLFKKREHDRAAYYIELSLVIALIGECMLLAMNQNILRNYAWIHVGVLSCCLLQSDKNKSWKWEMRKNARKT